jgi:hypothetical protein
MTDSQSKFRTKAVGLVTLAVIAGMLTAIYLDLSHEINRQDVNGLHHWLAE